MPNLKINNHAQRVMRYKLLTMGQGRWIKERDGHHKHYTEEEYKKSPMELLKDGWVISLV